VLVLDGVVIYPMMLAPLAIADPGDAALIDVALASDRNIAVVTRRPSPEQSEARAQQEAAEGGKPEVFDVACAATILRMLRTPDDERRLLIQGTARIRLVEYTQTEPFLVARVEYLKEHAEPGVELDALKQSVLDQFRRVVQLAPQLPEELYIQALNLDDPARLADQVAANLNLSVEERQLVLETLDVKERLRKVLEFLQRQLEILEVSTRIQTGAREEIEKGQREYILRQQLRQIQKELGETDQQEAEVQRLRERMEKASMSDEAKQAAEREIERLKYMNPASAEYGVVRTYLEWLIELPWTKSTDDRLDVPAARQILEQDHYDLERVKDRILEFLAVRKLKPEGKGPILCFIGPPGVGKTSLGRSIARALGRQFVRMSLGGIHDEAEIRGHRRTYVGALPGRIIQGIRKAGSNNPVFMLDEIDKVGADFRGDPSSALLEVLDPEQNFSFSDNYLEVPFDLSKVLFIATGNLLHPVPPALRDRMEVLELPGYTEEEKLAIAQRFLVPRQLSEHGLTAKNLTIPKPTLRRIIRDYTREAGLRNLEREIGAICRKVARRVAEGDTAKVRVRLADLPELLGPPKFYEEVRERTNIPGVAIGLAVTPSGGEILFVEATAMDGEHRLTLTGQLGDVMKESAQAALSYVRANARRLGIRPEALKDQDIHIHVPAGATPKDGPSAGVAMVTALVSLLTDRPVRPEVAMTGEVTLRGKVLPIGGVKEKTLAARRAGIKTVILPAKNEKDITEVPEDVRRDLRFEFAETIDDVLAVALNGRHRPVRKAQA
jgi:ATP-dependent Lon protease